MHKREAFGYESNALKLSNILVPDPFPRNSWNSFIQDWQSSAGNESILEWLILAGHIGEEALLHYLSAATGAKVILKPSAQESTFQSPESQLLRNLGFHPLASSGRRNLVAGGQGIPPDLKQFLGSAAEYWEWVIIPPLRGMDVLDPAVGESMPGTDTRVAENRLQQLLYGLWSRGVADIHFERTGDTLQIRTHESQSMQIVDTWHGESVVSNLRLLKTWAGFSTAAETLPQDGRISLDSPHGSIRFRASHLSTINGESLVLRNLDKQSAISGLSKLGVPAPMRKLLLDIALNEPGLTIFSGPTGSGKTTTLYALLEELRGQNRKILSIEDPVEYELAHAVQSDVNLTHGWSFDKAIRSYLRQDPDILILGEMRDMESAQAACRAALTGHCVLATLHAKSIETSLHRLSAWGIPDGMLQEILRLVVNQRLVMDEVTRKRKGVFSWKTEPGKAHQSV